MYENQQKHQLFIQFINLYGSSYMFRHHIDIETSARILCRCEALASLRHAHLGSFFLAREY
jgi:hypothetical protein